MFFLKFVYRSPYSLSLVVLCVVSYQLCAAVTTTLSQVNNNPSLGGNLLSNMAGGGSLASNVQMQMQLEHVDQLMSAVNVAAANTPTSQMSE